MAKGADGTSRDAEDLAEPGDDESDGGRDDVPESQSVPVKATTSGVMPAASAPAESLVPKRAARPPELSSTSPSSPAALSSPPKSASSAPLSVVQAKPALWTPMGLATVPPE